MCVGSLCVHICANSPPCKMHVIFKVTKVKVTVHRASWVKKKKKMEVCVLLYCILVQYSSTICTLITLLQALAFISPNFEPLLWMYFLLLHTCLCINVNSDGEDRRTAATSCLSPAPPPLPLKPTTGFVLAFLVLQVPNRGPMSSWLPT